MNQDGHERFGVDRDELRRQMLVVDEVRRMGSPLQPFFSRQRRAFCEQFDIEKWYR